MRNSKLNSIWPRIVVSGFAAATLVLAPAVPVQAAGLSNCADNGITAPCFEKIWSDGAQVKMTFVDLNPVRSNGPTHKFYVTAPQTRVPQGRVPFLHDHVIGDLSPQSRSDDRGGNPIRYHAYFVLCSAQGMSTGGCVPTMTTIPGLGTLPFAKTVDGHKLTSVDRIESRATSGLITVLDTGGEILATFKPGHGDESH
jgi:hypothetical protein